MKAPGSNTGEKKKDRKLRNRFDRKHFAGGCARKRPFFFIGVHITMYLLYFQRPAQARFIFYLYSLNHLFNLKFFKIVLLIYTYNYVIKISWFFKHFSNCVQCSKIQKNILTCNTDKIIVTDLFVIIIFFSTLMIVILSFKLFVQ